MNGIYSGKELVRGRVCASGGRRNPRLLLKISLESQRKKKPMSKDQLKAFFAKVVATPALKSQVDTAADASAVVAIAKTEGFAFSPASLERHPRG